MDKAKAKELALQAAQHLASFSDARTLVLEADRIYRWLMDRPLASKTDKEFQVYSGAVNLNLDPEVAN